MLPSQPLHDYTFLYFLQTSPVKNNKKSHFKSFICRCYRHRTRKCFFCHSYKKQRGWGALLRKSVTPTRGRDLFFSPISRAKPEGHFAHTASTSVELTSTAIARWISSGAR